MALSATDAARLASLLAARDKLIAGDKRSRVTYGSTTVEYSQADMTRLDSEISRLQAMDDTSSQRRGGAIRFRIV
jgi:hypothetical protein